LFPAGRPPRGSALAAALAEGNPATSVRPMRAVAAVPPRPMWRRNFLRVPVAWRGAGGPAGSLSTGTSMVVLWLCRRSLMRASALPACGQVTGYSLHHWLVMKNDLGQPLARPVVVG
jgi:hypothetical protein